MEKKRTGLVLPVVRLWIMALAYRLAGHPITSGFHPGLRSLIAYERGRFWHRVYERERISYYAHSFRGLWRKLRRW